MIPLWAFLVAAVLPATITGAFSLAIAWRNRERLIVQGMRVERMERTVAEHDITLNEELDKKISLLIAAGRATREGGG